MNRNEDVRYVMAVEQIIEFLFCPVCGAPATHTLVANHEGFPVVTPTWACGTDGCEYNAETGDKAWTVVSTT